MSKYGYVERGKDAVVDWAETGFKIAQDATEEKESREQLKRDLDQAADDLSAKSKEVPLGYNTTFNDRMMELSNQATPYLLEANKELKAGRLSPQDYMMKVNRLDESVDNVFKLSNNYNKLYEQHLERYDSGKAGEIERAIFESVDGMINFNENQFFITDDGLIATAPMIRGANGKMVPNKAAAKSSQALFNLAQNIVNKVDVEGEVKASADRLAEYVRTESAAATRSKTGLKTTVKDIRKMPEYSKLKESLIDNMLNSDLRTASVLSDYMSGYKVVTDKNKLPDGEDRENYIYIDISNGKEAKAMLTDKQNKAAREEIGLLLEGMIDSEYGEIEEAKVEASFAEKKYWMDQNKARENAGKSMNMLGLLYSAKNEEDVSSAISHFEGLNDNIRNIVRGDKDIKVYIYNKDTKKVDVKTIPYGSGFDSFAKSATLLTGIDSTTKSINSIDKSGMNIDSNGNIIKSIWNKEIDLKVAPDPNASNEADPDAEIKAVGSYISTNIVSNKELNEGNANQVLSRFGLSFKDGYLMKDGNKVSTAKIDLSKKYGRTTLAQLISSNADAITSFSLSQKALGSSGGSMSGY
jgi:hypothetical protein